MEVKQFIKAYQGVVGEKYIGCNVSAEHEVTGEIILLHKDYDGGLSEKCIYIGSWHTVLQVAQKHGENISGLFVICRNPDETVLYNKGNTVANYIEVNLPMAESYNLASAVFQQFWKKQNDENQTSMFLNMAMSGELSKRGQAYSNQAMNKLPYPFEEAFIVVVERSGGKYPEDNLLNELTRIFPAADIGRYQNDIVIIQPVPSMTMCLPEEQETELRTFLKARDCIGAVSNPFERADDTGVLFRMTKAYLDLCKDIMEQERLFTSEYGNIIYTVYLCWKQFSTEYGSEYFTYLTHPGLCALWEYDRANDTNLEEVLFTYLINNCSFTKTAEAMYVHRNTVINKMQRIKTIINDDLTKPDTIFKLLLSHTILQFDEKYYLDDHSDGANA